MSRSFIGIQRDARFSPHKEEADRAIFEAVASRLEARGHTVHRLSGQDFLNAFPDDNPAYDPAMVALLKRCSGFFSMARGADVNAMLDFVERFEHIPCVNTGHGVNICSSRSVLHEVLQDAEVPLPETLFGSLYAERLPNDPPEATSLLPRLAFPVWVKRSDDFTTMVQDCALVQDAPSALAVLQTMQERGVGEVAFSKHIAGDLVKFYGVAGADFFDWDYAQPSESKFGHERANGAPHRYPFDAAQLRATCERAARQTGIPVYGGDAVVEATGAFKIIDFNDWPSFSRCREQAADAIVQIILQAV